MPQRKSKLVDPKCWDLAMHFLVDISIATKEDCQELAESIQETIEDFLATYHVEPEDDDDYQS